MSSRSANKIRAPGRDRAGFTLIEVLISMAVLVMLSLGIYQATTSTFRLRDSLQREGDFYNNIRLAMDILQRDITLLYSPTIMLPPANPAEAAPESREQVAMKQLLSGDLGQATDFWAPAVDSSGVRPSRFLGTDSKLSFISVSHLRVYKNATESEFARVSYELRRDETAAVGTDAMVLVKTENTNAFEVEDRKDRAFIHTYPLLRGIKKLKYRYYRKDRDNWYNSWDSTTEDFKNIYPDIVEITVEVSAGPTLNFEGKYVFRPEVPLRGLDPST